MIDPAIGILGLLVIGLGYYIIREKIMKKPAENNTNNQQKKQ